MRVQGLGFGVVQGLGLSGLGPRGQPGDPA